MTEEIAADDSDAAASAREAWYQSTIAKLTHWSTDPAELHRIFAEEYRACGRYLRNARKLIFLHASRHFGYEELKYYIREQKENTVANWQAYQAATGASLLSLLLEHNYVPEVLAERSDQFKTLLANEVQQQMTTIQLIEIEIEQLEILLTPPRAKVAAYKVEYNAKVAPILAEWKPVEQKQLKLRAELDRLKGVPLSEPVE